MAEKTVNATAEDDFLQALAGEGLEEIDSSATSTSYLGLVQPGSTLESEECPAGTWRNSSTGKSYGNEVEAVVLGFSVVWSERESYEPYRTVARYQPNSIEVTVQQPPKGARGYPKMINPDSGNEIQELYVYALVLADHPEDGVLYFSPTAGSMKTCRQWNSAIKQQTLSNGAAAPIFGCRWKLICGLVANPKQPNRKMARFTSFEKAGVTSKDLFTSRVQPVFADVKKGVLRIAQGALDEPVDDSEERKDEVPF